MYKLLNVFLVLLLLTLLCLADMPIQPSPVTATPPKSLLQFTSGGHVLGFGPGELYMAACDHVLKVEFVNASQSAPLAQTSGSGQCTAAPLRKVTYKNAWKGIDIVYTPVDGGIAESTYVIHPGGDPAQIALRYNVPLEIAPQGGLQLGFQNGYMTEGAPIAWQEISGVRVPVDVRFVKQGEAQAGFSLGLYDAGNAVYIDPVYVWHTFYGSTNIDEGRAITVDASGNVYVTGYSASTWNGPGGIAPLNPYAGDYDIVIIKLSGAGAYLWHTFYGSSTGRDNGLSISLHSAGSVYVTGRSNASWIGPGGIAPVNPYAGDWDIVVIKLSGAGAYLWHTFYGSSTGRDVGYGITMDTAGNVYVTGFSDATWNGPGGTAPLYPFSGTSAYDIAVLKLSGAGAYRWHSFFGSSSSDYAYSIALDAAGNVYVTGFSAATWNGPGGTAPLNPYAGGIDDIVVVKLSGAGAYQWHAFYGSPTIDVGLGIALDAAGNVYVTGYSAATWNGPGGIAPLNPYAGDYDIVIIKLSGAGAYLWHTFYGSSISDYAYSIVLDAAGNTYMVGYSYATWNGPGNTAPVYPFTGIDDIIVLKLSSAGAYLWHAFYGSATNDQGMGIAMDASGNVYVSGTSMATWNGPGAAAPLNPYTGNGDIFVVKMSGAPPSITSFTPSCGDSRTIVTITGKNFLCATSVSFGVVPTSQFRVDSNTQITATVGTNATGKIKVTTPAGTATSKLNFDPCKSGTPYGSWLPGTTSTSTPTEQVRQVPVSMAAISVKSASLSGTKVAPGTPVTVKADVVNTGNAGGSSSIQVYVNDVIDATQGVTVNSGSSTPVTFTVSRSEPGTYSVYVGGTSAGSFTVDQFADPNIILYTSGALVLLAIILGIIYMARRRTIK